MIKYLVHEKGKNFVKITIKKKKQKDHSLLEIKI